MCQVFILYFAFLTALASMVALSMLVVREKLLLSDVFEEIDNLMYMSNSAYETLSRASTISILLGLTKCIVFLIACLISLICFVFSQILFHGIKNSRSSLLKTYLEFGSLFTMLVATSTVGHMIYDGGMPAGYVLIACVFYICVLCIIQVIYKSMKDTPVLSNVTSE